MIWWYCLMLIQLNSANTRHSFQAGGQGEGVLVLVVGTLALKDAQSILVNGAA